MQSKSAPANVTIEGHWAATTSSPAGRRLRKSSLRGAARKRKSKRRMRTPGWRERAGAFQASAQPSAAVQPVRVSVKARAVNHRSVDQRKILTTSTICPRPEQNLGKVSLAKLYGKFPRWNFSRLRNIAGTRTIKNVGLPVESVESWLECRIVRCFCFTHKTKYMWHKSRFHQIRCLYASLLTNKFVSL